MTVGADISIKNGKLIVPNEPLVHYIEGDGIGVDITPVMISVVNAAVDKAYSQSRKIHWNEVYAGQKAFDLTGEWLPCLLYTSPSPRDRQKSRMPSSA